MHGADRSAGLTNLLEHVFVNHRNGCSGVVKSLDTDSFKIDIDKQSSANNFMRSRYISNIIY